MDSKKIHFVRSPENNIKSQKTGRAIISAIAPLIGEDRHSEHLHFMLNGKHLTLLGEAAYRRQKQRDKKLNAELQANQE